MNNVLEVSDDDLDQLYNSELQQLVVLLRKAIRYHRDQRGDDRCFLDDAKLYESLPERVAVDTTLPPQEEFLASCKKFHECRQGKIFPNMDGCYDAGSYRSLNTPNQNSESPEKLDSLES